MRKTILLTLAVVLFLQFFVTNANAQGFFSKLKFWDRTAGTLLFMNAGDYPLTVFLICECTAEVITKRIEPGTMTTFSAADDIRLMSKCGWDSSKLLVKIRYVYHNEELVGSPRTTGGFFPKPFSLATDYTNGKIKTIILGTKKPL